MTHPTLECFRCGKPLDNIMGEDGQQPVGGLTFSTCGHYGSAFFDPLDGSSIELSICDECLSEKQHLLYHYPPTFGERAKPTRPFRRKSNA